MQDMEAGYTEGEGLFFVGSRIICSKEQTLPV